MSSAKLFYILDAIFQLKFSLRDLFCESDSTFSFIRSSPNKNCPFYDSLERSNFSKSQIFWKIASGSWRQANYLIFRRCGNTKFLSKSSIKIKHYDKRQKKTLSFGLWIIFNYNSLNDSYFDEMSVTFLRSKFIVPTNLINCKSLFHFYHQQSYIFTGAYNVPNINSPNLKNLLP